MGADMRTWRKRPDEFLGEPYVPGGGLPAEAAALGARIVAEADGSETLITAEREIYPLREGGVITIRRGKVGYNDRGKLEELYEELPERGAV